VTQIESRKDSDARPSTATWRRIERPLQSVVGLADMLADRSRDISAAARNEMIDQLAAHVRGVEQAVDNLIVATRLRNGEIEFESDPVDLRELIELAAQEWTLDHGAHLSVVGGIGAICDREWVVHVMRAVFDDAFSRGARNLTVRISEAYSKAVVEVDDDGEPIPDSDLESLADVQHRSQALDWEGDVLGHGVAVGRGLARGMGGDFRYFRQDDMNTCELTLRKQSTSTSPRGHLPKFSVETVVTEPSRADILTLIDEGSLTVVYQPLVDIRGDDAASRPAIGFESLARFPHSSPPEWFKVAGSAGIGLDLELLAIRAGVQGFETRELEPFLALNLSNATLLSPQLATAIEGIDPGRIVLELSDTARIRSYEVTRRAIDSLRERGIRLAVDDVGAGEIDMWHILRLDPEVIKLDRHLVADHENVRRNDALIKGLTTMAKDLGIMVIAEAIETERERQRLLELGVEFGQGYLFGKPEPLQWKSRVLSDPD
jgi:EAL domain-containing protein (putative c-di-GMP-specific phosphodiesterase class I)